MNRTAFSLPARSQYRTHGGLEVSRSVEQFTGGASRLDDLIDLLDRRRGVVLSSGTTVPGRYESFDLGFSDPPLVLETEGANFSLHALNGRGEVLIAFLGDVLRELVDECRLLIARDHEAASPMCLEILGDSRNPFVDRGTDARLRRRCFALADRSRDVARHA